MEQPLDVDISDGVARITLNRPDAANSIDLAMARALCATATRLACDPAVRAVLLRGSGRMFCGGGDLRSFDPLGDELPAHLMDVTTNLHAAVARFARMNAPVVVAVHGSAAGAGFSLACAGDLVLAAESATFVPAYSAVGLTPDGSLTASLPRLVGLRRALELVLTNRRLTAAEALSWGLVTTVVEDEALFSHADALAQRLAAGPTVALGGAKRLLRASLDQPLEAQMEAETQALAAAAATADGQEGIAAFVAKRSPEFAGRSKSP